MEWYVLNYNFNLKKIEPINIFNYGNFLKDIKEIYKEYIERKEDIEFFENKINSQLLYYFWSKREYEISVGDLFEKDLEKYEKIDVYYQVKMNFKVFIEYLLNNISIDN